MSRVASTAPQTVDRSFRAMGTDVRIVACPVAGAAAGAIEAGVARAEALVHACAARLTRFDAGSELRRLGTNPSPIAEVSPMLAHAIDAALRAAESSGGLLDPTLVAPIENAGYDADWDPRRRLPLVDLLGLAPARRPARPSTASSWRTIAVDVSGRRVQRPPGLALDLAATAKGLIADLALRAIGPAQLAFVDAGGDLAIAAPRLEVLAADPFDRDAVALTVTGPCGLATSSIAGRCWLGDDGPAHHLIDPLTGRPAFTGVVQATAAGPNAAAAEALAGQALLAGPVAAPHVLAQHGGLVVLDDGTTHLIPGALLR